MVRRAAMLGAFVALNAAPLHAQSVLDRPPNLHDTWVAPWGVVHFHFMHRFQEGGPPERNVRNSPTFLLAAGLPARALVGARYATNSPWVRGFPNEWEFFVRSTPLAQADGTPLDVGFTAAYNQAADSFDGQIALARRAGPLRLLAAARGFSSAFRRPEARAAIAAGATLQLTESIALAADLASLVAAEPDEKAAWSAGVQLRIPTTPHTLSLHASNAHTTTLQGASIGSGSTLWGFEFTVPITLSRYIRRRSSDARSPIVQPVPGRGVIEIEMSDLAFEPRGVRIQVGDTIRWTNSSALVHTVTGDPQKAMRANNVILPDGAAPFDSGMMRPGDIFTYVFTVAGEYTYVCVPHELAGMLGTVTVTERRSSEEVQHDDG